MDTDPTFYCKQSTIVALAGKTLLKSFANKRGCYLPVLRIRDVYPGSRILIFTPDPVSRIPDPKAATKERGEKKICCHNFLCSHNFHKTANYFSIDVLKKKIWANFQRIITFFTIKIVNKLSKIWVWNPGSGKNLFRIPDPGVKKAPDPGSATLLLTEHKTHL
jgi:hypothetical protein